MLKARLTVHAVTALSEVVAFVTPSVEGKLVTDYLLEDGTGTGQANGVFAERYTLAPLETEVIDLGGLTDDLGQALRFTAIKFLVVQAAATNQSYATLKPNGTHPWTAPFGSASDVVNIARDGGVLVLGNGGANGWPIVEDSSDKLLLSNPSASESIQIDLMVVGVGAFS